MPGAPHPDEEYSTFQAALAPIEWVAHLDPAAGFVAGMPGDDISSHPLAHTAKNPFPGMSLQAMLAFVREGTLDAATERKVNIYVDQYRRLTGEVLTDERNHTPICSTEQGTAEYDTLSPIESGGLHRVDPFDLGDFRWGDHS